jgi:hypothetical protein
MSNVIVYTFTVFHSLSAVVIFGLMVFGAVSLVSRQRN